MAQRFFDADFLGMDTSTTCSADASEHAATSTAESDGEACTLEEHELPSVEAVLAGTLALMTGYSQALQAELAPDHRMKMGVKVVENLELLASHPQLSLGFRQVLLSLGGRWQSMRQCTEEAARDVEADCTRASTSAQFQFTAPKRLQ